MGRRNEYQPKGGDALRLGSEGRYGSYAWQVKLCDPLIVPYLSALEIRSLCIKRYINSPSLLYFTLLYVHGPLSLLCGAFTPVYGLSLPHGAFKLRDPPNRGWGSSGMVCVGSAVDCSTAAVTL